MKQQDNDKVVSAKHALDDYFDDLLGGMATTPSQGDSVSAAPQEKQEAAPETPPQQTISRDEEKPRLAQQNSTLRSSSAPASGQRRAPDNAPSSRINREQVRPQRQNQATPASLQPAPVAPKRSPIIPAAFPKLAPQTQVDEQKATATASATAEKPVKPDTAPATAPKPASPKAPPAKAEPVPAQQASPVTAKAVTEPAAETKQQAPAPETQQAVPGGPQPWRDNGRPEWAQERFEALLFSVAGLKLAVPLISLGSIHKMDQELTPLFGRAPWFMGLYQSGERNIRVVDTARWVMPDRYHEAVKSGYQFIIRLGDSDWGMACDSVAQAIQLQPEQVKWRSERSKRPWLSGTVIDHMCALLDADTLGYLLDTDAKRH